MEEVDYIGLLNGICDAFEAMKNREDKPSPEIQAGLVIVLAGSMSN
jgi:hypothetical protein